MNERYKLIAMPMLPSEQFPEQLVTFIASDSVESRRKWTVYCGDLTRLFGRLVSRTEAEKIVSALRRGLDHQLRWHLYTPTNTVSTSVPQSGIIFRVYCSLCEWAGSRSETRKHSVYTLA